VFGTLRTLFLFAVLTLLFMIAGWVAAGYGMMGGDIVGAMLLFGVFAAVLNFAAYFWSHKFVLWSYKAKIVSDAEAPRLHAIVRRLSQQAHLPMPQVAIIPLQVPNAFATGRSPKHAVVAATQGILEMLDDDELEGVMAHELGHVRNRDMLVMSVAATVAGAVTFAARMLFWNALFGGGGNRNPLTAVVGIVFMILAPIVAILVQLAISRGREFKADKMGAHISGKPWALASALEKMERIAIAAPLDRVRQANPSTSSLFIVNPFRGGMSAMFRTHPSTTERVKRLRAMN
jgi:heat shock protein HtpX